MYSVLFLIALVAVATAQESCFECRHALAHELWINEDSSFRSLNSDDVRNKYSAALQKFKNCEKADECKAIDDRIFSLHDPFYTPKIDKAVKVDYDCLAKAQIRTSTECRKAHHTELHSAIKKGEDPGCPLILGFLEEFDCRKQIYEEDCGKVAKVIFDIGLKKAKDQLVGACKVGHCDSDHRGCKAVIKSPAEEVKTGATQPKPRPRPRVQPPVPRPAPVVVPPDVTKYYCAKNIQICQTCKGYECQRYAEETYDSAKDCAQQSSCQSVFVPPSGSSNRVLSFKPASRA